MTTLACAVLCARGMTAARQVIAGRTYMITRRCTQRQLLLRPDDYVEQVFLYCLGEAAERYAITLHGFVAMGNHEHLVVRDNRGNFPEFLAQFHKMVAKAMNKHLGRWENFWSNEQANAVHLVEPDDRFDKLVYVLANPIKAGLVDRISDWPGASSFGLHMSGRADRTIKKPRGYFRTSRQGGLMPEMVTIRLERMDGFEHLSEEEWNAKLKLALREEEEKARRKLRSEARRVLGRKRVLRAQPMDTPATVERRRRLRPTIACRNKARRLEELAALVSFRVDRFMALVRMHEGESDVIFPVGTYRVQRFVGRPAEPPLALSA